MPPLAMKSSRLVGHGGTLFEHSTKTGGGQVMVGGMFVVMLILWRQLAEFVQSSTTVCVRKKKPPQVLPVSGPSTQK